VKVPTLIDIVRWDDRTLLEWRERASAELRRNPDPALQRTFDAATVEITNRIKAR
jgi:hypothetical protein